MSFNPDISSIHRFQRRAMNLSLLVGILMVVLKFGAYLLTHSTAVLADAMETLVHVAAVVFASFSLRVSQRPPDSSHPYGHSKVSFFSAGIEGALIIIAAFVIIFQAIKHWILGSGLANLGWGIGLTTLSIFINLALGIYLLRKGKKSQSLILEANGRHILTDAWTSIGVVGGLLLVVWTGWYPWDPILAIVVSLNILVSGYRLMRRSVAGLMDEANPAYHVQIQEVLAREVTDKGYSYHALKHRSLGDGGYWVDFHLLFDDQTTLKDAHQKATEIERAIDDALPSRTRVTTHLEPLQSHHEIHPDSLTIPPPR